MRIDKFIWCARLTKTRSQATDLIQKKRIQLDQVPVKPSRDIKVGSVVSVLKANAKFSYQVISLVDKRVNASLIPNVLIDITPQEERDKYKTYLDAQKIYRDNGTGKPTKKDRRQLGDFWDDWTEAD